MNVDTQDMATDEAMTSSSSPVQAKKNLQSTVHESETTRPSEILNSTQDRNVSTDDQTTATSFVTFRTNPNGSRVSISRPSVSSLRRVSHEHLSLI